MLHRPGWRFRLEFRLRGKLEQWPGIGESTSEDATTSSVSTSSGDPATSTTEPQDDEGSSSGGPPIAGAWNVPDCALVVIGQDHPNNVAYPTTSEDEPEKHDALMAEALNNLAALEFEVETLDLGVMNGKVSAVVHGQRRPRPRAAEEEGLLGAAV